MSLIASGTRLVVRALAFDAGGSGFDTRQWVGKFGVRLLTLPSCHLQRCREHSAPSFGSGR